MCDDGPWFYAYGPLPLFTKGGTIQPNTHHIGTWTQLFIGIYFIRSHFPGYIKPLPRLALKHTAVSQFSGKKPEFTAWTRDARYYAKGVGFLSAFVSDPPQYVPVGELDTENSVLVGRGYNREHVHIYALAWKFYRRL